MNNTGDLSMTIAPCRNPFLSIGAGVALGTILLLAASGAAAFQADSSTGVSATAPIDRKASGRQLWRISDYTTIELVAREPGAPANQHPWTVEPNTLHAWLQQVQVARNGKARPLFAIDELSNIVPAITAALANARPDQDIALVSSARHEDNSFFGITAVTARLFVVDGHLNLIVHDARVDFYDAARGSGLAPHFTVGSRTSQGSSTISSATATDKRADWLVLGTVEPAAAAPVAPTMTPPGAAVSAPPAPAAPPVPAAQDAEQRLLTLKRLYDKGLITKSEYEKKRADILKEL
jgi:hypothetical protein